MSLTMTKADGVTVLTLTSDPESSCPPLCQILKALCYSPACCAVSQHLRRVQRYYQSLLGALHIMIGLLNIGLGQILISIGASWRQMDASGFPYWLGEMFIFLGILSILTEKHPSPCLVILNMILNLSTVAFGIAAIVLYIINMRMFWMWQMYDDRYSTGYYEGQTLTRMLVRGINVVLIVLSILEICVAIASFLLAITALGSREKREDESTDEPEHYKLLLEEVTSDSTT